MNEHKSIFEIERRSDLCHDYSMLMMDMKVTTVRTKGMVNKRLHDFLDESIQFWPYRQASSSVNMYLRNLGIANIGYNHADTILALELYANLLHWAQEYDERLADPFSAFNWDCNVKDICNKFIEDIVFILEQNNMSIRREDTEPCVKYRIFKRDAFVDSVLDTVPELSELLLSYLDIRNVNNIKFKRIALKSLADYLEPLRDNYKGTSYSDLCKIVFTVFNKCSIRHNDLYQLKMDEQKQVEIYDTTFKMCLHLLQMDDVNGYKKEVKEMIDCYDEGNQNG